MGSFLTGSSCEQRQGHPTALPEGTAHSLSFQPPSGKLRNLGSKTGKETKEQKPREPSSGGGCRELHSCFVLCQEGHTCLPLRTWGSLHGRRAKCESEYSSQTPWHCSQISFTCTEKCGSCPAALPFPSHECSSDNFLFFLHLFFSTHF